MHDERFRGDFRAETVLIGMGSDYTASTGDIGVIETR